MFFKYSIKDKIEVNAQFSLFLAFLRNIVDCSINVFLKSSLFSISFAVPIGIKLKNFFSLAGYGLFDSCDFKAYKNKEREDCFQTAFDYFIYTGIWFPVIN